MTTKGKSRLRTQSVCHPPYLLTYVLSDHATSPQHPGVTCEGQVFLTSGRWGTSPTWGPPPPCEQALSLAKSIYYSADYIAVNT